MFAKIHSIRYHWRQGIDFKPEHDNAGFKWLLEQMRSFFAVHDTFSYFVFSLTDQDLAGVNALESIFPKAPTLIYPWRVNKEAIAYCHHKQG